jgi:starch synthase (maltosyl-transferring)
MNDFEGKKRVVIENVRPEIEGGRYPVKKAVGDYVRVRADIFADGHDTVRAELLHRKEDSSQWLDIPMVALVNDRWEASFPVGELGVYYYTLRAWVDHFRTWQSDLGKKAAAGEDVAAEIGMGARLIRDTAQRALDRDARHMEKWAQALEGEPDQQAAVAMALSEELTALMQAYPPEDTITRYERELPVRVDPARASFSAWYELFPRSWGSERGRHGTFRDCERLLPEIARMGFDVVYLPPVHPIGVTNRKGGNNSPSAEPGEPGSPWAIGSEDGGHKTVHPELGTLDDFRRFVRSAADYGIDVALDIAFQCSMDHPYIREHPDWFRWRPDGTVQYAENPPKKYQDVVPLNFETDDWPDLWRELRSVFEFWIEQGVRIFRVDNPHTKPFAFWEWVIGEIKRDHPETVFLAEAFTRPKVMYRLAKLGFTQSYTYFTWRNSRQELTQYLRELTETRVRDFFRPNFWPNTPDILPEILQYGGRPAFIIRLVLAATLSSNYGIYGPAFELCVSEAVPGKEEYLNSEKYEIKDWNWDEPGNLKDLIAKVNRIRKENPALQRTNNVFFLESDNEYVLFYMKATPDFGNVVLVATTLDPFHPQPANIRVPLEYLGVQPGQPYLLHDLVGEEKHVWIGDWNRIEIDPGVSPARIFLVHSRMRRESDFDYFM